MRDPTRRDQLHLSHLSSFSGVIPCRKTLLVGRDGYAPRFSYLAESGGNFISRLLGSMRARGKTGLDGKGTERFYRAFPNGFCDYPLRRKRRFLDGGSGIGRGGRGRDFPRRRKNGRIYPQKQIIRNSACAGSSASRKAVKAGAQYPRRVVRGGICREIRNFRKTSGDGGALSRLREKSSARFAVSSRLSPAEGSARTRPASVFGRIRRGKIF